MPNLAVSDTTSQSNAINDFRKSSLQISRQGG
jgi:hypothetical protein